jgi:glycosyltransferase involved in cell wall biosynthesis
MIVWLVCSPYDGDLSLPALFQNFWGLTVSSDLRAISVRSRVEGRFLLPPEKATESGAREAFYQQLSDSPEIHIIQTHEVPWEGSPALYVTRDGRSSLYEYYLRQHRKSPLDKTRLLEIVLGKGQPRSWSDHLLAWKNQSNCRVVRHELLVQGDENTLLEIEALWKDQGKILSRNNASSGITPAALAQSKWTRPTDWNDRVDEAFWAVHSAVMQELSYGPAPSGVAAQPEDWQSLTATFAERHRLVSELHEARDKSESMEQNFHDISWIRRQLRRLKRRKPKLWKNPVYFCHYHLARSHPWQPGKLFQYPPIPLVLSPLPPARLADAQLPSLAVVVPSFQQGPYLERTLRSLLDQHYPNLQLALMDGGSTDETLQVLETYRDRLTHVQSGPDGGQAAAINAGFQRVSGEICYWLNSDDILLPGAARFVAEYFVQNPEVDVIYGSRILINAQDQEIGRQILPAHHPESLYWFDAVPQETLFFRRSAWDRVGGLNSGFRFALDWDLLVRLQQTGSNIVRLPFFLGCFRVHEEQKTLTQIKSVGEPEVDLIRQRVLGPQFQPEKLRRLYTRHRAWAAFQGHLEHQSIYRKARDYFWSRR